MLTLTLIDPLSASGRQLEISTRTEAQPTQPITTYLHSANQTPPSPVDIPSDQDGEPTLNRALHAHPILPIRPRLRPARHVPQPRLPADHRRPIPDPDPDTDTDPDLRLVHGHNTKMWRSPCRPRTEHVRADRGRHGGEAADPGYEGAQFDQEAVRALQGESHSEESLWGGGEGWRMGKLRFLLGRTGR